MSIAKEFYDRIVIWASNSGFVVDLAAREILFGGFPQTSKTVFRGADGTERPIERQRSAVMRHVTLETMEHLQTMQRLDCPVRMVAIGRARHVLWYEPSIIDSTPERSGFGAFANDRIELTNYIFEAGIHQGRDLFAGIPWECTDSNLLSTFDANADEIIPGTLGSGETFDPFVLSHAVSMPSYIGPYWQVADGDSVDGTGLYSGTSAVLEMELPLGGAELTLNVDAGQIQYIDWDGDVLATVAAGVASIMPGETMFIRATVTAATSRPELSVVDAGAALPLRDGECVACDERAVNPPWQLPPGDALEGPYVVFLGRRDNSYSEGMFVFDARDVTGTYQRLMERTLIGRMEHHLLNTGADGFIHYACQDITAATTNVEIRKIRPDGSEDQRVFLTAESGIGGIGSHVSLFDGVYLVATNTKIFRVNEDGSDLTLLVTSASFIDLAFMRDGDHWFMPPTGLLQKRLVLDGSIVGIETTNNWGRLQIDFENAWGTAVPRVYSRGLDPLGGGPDDIRKVEHNFVGFKTLLDDVFSDGAAGERRGLASDFDRNQHYGHARNLAGEDKFTRWDYDDPTETFINPIDLYESDRIKFAYAFYTVAPIWPQSSNVVNIYHCNTAGEIKKADPDGLNVTTIASLVGCSAKDCAFSQDEGRLFVACQTANKIVRMESDGTGQTDWLTSQTTPWGIEVDEVFGKVFWVVATEARSANLDASGVTAVLAGGFKSLGFDSIAQKLYLADNTNGLIKRCDPNGDNVETVATLADAATVDVDPNGLYFFYGDDTGEIVWRRLKDLSAAAEEAYDLGVPAQVQKIAIDKGEEGGIHLYLTDIDYGLYRAMRLIPEAPFDSDIGNVSLTPIFPAGITNIQGIALQYNS